MSRHGLALLPVLVALTIAGTAAAILAAPRDQRRAWNAARLVRVQAAEYAQGLRALPPGTVLSSGVWRLEHRADGQVVATHPRGTLSVSGNGDERWEPAR